MATTETHGQTDGKRLEAVIVGGGVAAIETVLALHELAPDHVSCTVIAPNDELVYRPMTVREPFAFAQARRYRLSELLCEGDAKLLCDELSWVDRPAHAVHLRSGASIEFDALVIALGAHAHARYEHAITIDDRHLDEALHGALQDIEEGYARRVAFVSPGRMAWPLPLYELALMTADRARDMGVELEATLITPEDAPLAIFGAAASEAVAKLLADANVKTLTSAYAEVPHAGEVIVNPGDRRLTVDRVIALPELYGPKLRGVPLSSHGFLRVNAHGNVFGTTDVYAAGDATEFPVKHGGIASQQADAVAHAIAARAGAPVSPAPFHPVVHGILLTGGKPLYLSAHITGGHGSSSAVLAKPDWDPPQKIAARYLSPRIDAIERSRGQTHAGA